MDTNKPKNEESVLPFGRRTLTDRSIMRAEQDPEELSTSHLAQDFAEMADAGYIVHDTDEF